MMKQRRGQDFWRTSLLVLGAAGAALSAAGGPASAQSADAPVGREPVASEDIVVPGAIAYRNRSESIAPILEYGLDYFQRFEPPTVGDMLKRVPSVAFVSDVLEFDAVRLRGLAPAYTQILINGERVPGAEADRSFFVDRIPAELVERVEIVRGSSADRPGDAVAGALNIVLRDAYSLEGGFARGGLVFYNDDEVRQVFGATIAGPLGPARIILGLDVQDRYNPKAKTTEVFNSDGELEEFAAESDVRDGTDYALNAGLVAPVGAGELDLRFSYVRTDRDQREDAVTNFLNGDPSELAGQDELPRPENASFTAAYDFPMMGGQSTLQFGYATYRDEANTFEFESEAPDPLEPDVFEVLDVNDDEYSFTFAHSRALGSVTLAFGVDVLQKERAGGGIVAPFEDDAYVVETDFTYALEEFRVDPYVKLSGEAGAFEWEAGLRYETTDFDYRDLTSLFDTDTGDLDDTFSTTPVDTSYEFLLPSVSLVWNMTDADRVLFSASRTVRRPDFDFLTPPVPLEEEPIDSTALIGNPLLEPEDAQGFDLGYERRLGRTGIVGINYFYRDISDVIELAGTGETTDDDFDIVQYRNAGDGKLWGVELDLSTSLSFVGLEHTGIFLNYSWLDSEIFDVNLNRDRRFNGQPDYVVNVGFIQDLPPLGAAFGVTYREQGEAFESFLGETVLTSYDGDLEAFIEKRFGNFVLRLTGYNLLDQEKFEDIRAFESAADQAAGLVDSYEIEREQSGPVYQLIGRVAF